MDFLIKSKMFNQEDVVEVDDNQINAVKGTKLYRHIFSTYDVISLSSTPYTNGADVVNDYINNNIIYFGLTKSFKRGKLTVSCSGTELKFYTAKFDEVVPLDSGGTSWNLSTIYTYWGSLDNNDTLPTTDTVTEL